jgi:two-component system, NtrC family, nitrogen regulation response regulator NtrX
MKSILYLGCPAPERADAEKLLGEADVAVVWADNLGNATELRTLLNAVVVGLQGGRGIGIEDVLAHVRLDGGPVVSTEGGTLKQARARFEKEYIAATLEQHRGRISDAAKALGIQRTNLYRKMRSLRVDRKDGRG